MSSLRIIILAIFAIYFSTSVLAESSNNPVFLYASQSGEKTFDQGEGGGNPFAKAMTGL